MKFRLVFIDFRFKLIFLVSLFVNTTFAQQHDLLLNQAYEFVNSNPEEALKIGNHLLKNSKSDSEKSNFHFLMAQSYWAKGNYNNAVIAIYEAGKYATDESQKVEILLFKSEILRLFYLDDQSKIYFEKAKEITNDIQLTDVKSYFLVKNSIENSKIKRDRQNAKEALLLLDRIDKNYKAILSKNSDLQNDFYFAKANSFIALSKLDSSQFYLDKVLVLSQTEFKNNTLNKIAVLRNYGTLYFLQKDHLKAIESLFEAKKLSQTLKNNLLLELINRQLSLNFLALNDKVNHQLYDSEFLKLHNNNEVLEQEAVNSAYNLINQEQEDDLQFRKRQYVLFLYFVCGVFIVTVIIGALIWYKSCTKNKRLSEIIKYLQISRNNSLNILPEKKEINKKTTIPFETEQNILGKLKRFESSKKFTNKEMSLAVLAGQFDTNTKYLSEIINKHYQDNFNTYINKLRINFIIEKLKTDSNFMHYKISYLAEKSGFSSHSSFATVFKSITKIAPVTFIELLKEETETMNKEKTESYAE